MNSSEKVHAKCSASGAGRWLACPGSVWACMQVEPKPTTIYAEEGTKCHSVAEFILEKCMAANWEQKITNKFAAELKEQVPEEMIEAALFYIAAIFSEVNKFDAPPSIRIESKLTFDEDMQMFGTADCAMTGFIGGEAVGTILDLKYGKTKVSALENPQLAYYACAMRKTSKKDLKRIRVIIVQPRIKHPITEVDYSSDELDAWDKKLTLGAQKALLQIITPTAREFNIGKHCKWCDGLTVCPAKNKPPAEGEGLEFIEV